jgi:Rrf2 family protein
MLSNACKYAIRSSIYIALSTQKGEKVSIKEVAENINSPVAFTAKILQKLVKSDIVLSSRGIGGGFWLASNKADKIFMIDIVRAIDDAESLNACVLGLNECSEKMPCPAHKDYKHIKASILEMLHKNSLGEMVKDLEKEKAFLKLI